MNLKHILLLFSWFALMEAALIEDMVRRLLEELRDGMRGGLPQVGIPSLDPIVIQQYQVEPLSEYLQLQGILENIRIENLSGFDVVNVETNTKEESLVVSLKWIKDISVTGQRYDLQGMFMKNIPIYGKGKFDINIEELELDIEVVFDANTRRIKDLDYKIRGETEFNVEGFYPGTSWGDQINEMLTTRAISFLNKMSPQISKGLIKIINTYLEDTAIDDIPQNLMDTVVPLISINNILDPIFANLRMSLSEQGGMSIGLPGDEDIFTVNIFDANLNGTMAIYGGEIRGLDSLHRVGEADFSPLRGTITATIGVNNLAVAYYALLKLNLLGTDIGIDLTIGHIQMFAEISITGDIEITELTIPEVGQFEAKIKLFSILDPFVDLLLDSVLNLVGESLITPLAGIIQQLLNNLLASNPQILWQLL